MQVCLSLFIKKRVLIWIQLKCSILVLPQKRCCFIIFELRANVFVDSRRLLLLLTNTGIMATTVVTSFSFLSNAVIDHLAWTQHLVVIVHPLSAQLSYVQGLKRYSRDAGFDQNAGIGKRIFTGCGI